MDCTTFKQALITAAKACGGKLKENHVICASDSTYDAARQIRNTRFDYKPFCIVKCQNTQDVQATINLCRDNELSVRIRSGGHQHEGMCSANDVVIIDLGDLEKELTPQDLDYVEPQGDCEPPIRQKIRISSDLKTVKITPGTQLEQVYATLGDDTKKLTIPGGGCDSVNIGGLVQGGGWGLLARSNGLTCDSLQEVELVTADGQIIHANDHNEHAELLKAIRGGGGGNFGVLTDFKLTLTADKPTELLTKNYSSSDTSQLKRILAAYLNRLESFSPEITTFARVNPFNDEEKKVMPTVRMIFHCIGTENENPALKEVEAFIEKLEEENGIKSTPANAINDIYPNAEALNAETLTEFRFSDATQILSGVGSGALAKFSLYPAALTGGFADSNDNWRQEVAKYTQVKAAAPGSTCEQLRYPHKVSSAFPKGNTTGDYEELANRAIDFISQKEGTDFKDFKYAATYLSIHSLGGACKKQEFKDQSYFYYRDKSFMLQFQAWWGHITPQPGNQEKPEDYINWIHEFREALTGGQTEDSTIEGAFINFPDQDLDCGLEADEFEKRLRLLRYYYGENLDKLRNVKHLYDPEEFFSFKLGIPPSEVQ